jgi:hypothetical protein
MPDKRSRREILRIILRGHEEEMPGAVDRKLLMVRRSCFLSIASAAVRESVSLQVSHASAGERS